MKTVVRIIAGIFVVVACFVSFVFAFIELRPLFAGDFLLMNNSAIAFIRYLLRGLFFIILAINAVAVIISLGKEEVSYTHHTICCGLILASFLTIFFYDGTSCAIAILCGIIPYIVLSVRKLLKS